MLTGKRKRLNWTAEEEKVLKVFIAMPY